jgi:hypothetical protein
MRVMEEGPSSSPIRCDIFVLNPKTAPLDYGESFALQQLDAADVSDGSNCEELKVRNSSPHYPNDQPFLQVLEISQTGQKLPFVSPTKSPKNCWRVVGRLPFRDLSRQSCPGRKHIAL